MRGFVRTVALPAILCWPAAFAAAEPCTFPAHADIPLAVVPGAVRTSALIAGQPVMLDVGIGGSVTRLWPKTADRLGLKRSPSAAYVADGHPVEMYLTDPVSFAIGTMNWPATEIAVIDTKESHKSEVDGVLGYDALARYDVDLDVAHGRITLYQTAGDCRQPVSPRQGDVSIIPFRAESRSNAQPIFKVTVNGRTYLASLNLSDVAVTAASSLVKALGVVGSDGKVVRNSPDLDLTLGGIDMKVKRARIVDRLRTDIAFGAPFLRMVRFWISNSSHTLIVSLEPERDR